MKPITTEATLLSPQQCRILLTDITCCSLMRLDTTSMDKLWDLMTMLYKWQMFVAKSSNDVLDITLRHLGGIEKMLPDSEKTLIIDNARAVVVAFWNRLIDLDRIEIRNRIIKWLRPYNMKISVLLRLGLQRSDASFEDNLDGEHFKKYIKHIGENIYEKTSGICSKDVSSYNGKINEKSQSTMQLESLVSQLNIHSKQNVISQREGESIDVKELILDETRCVNRNMDSSSSNRTEYLLINSNNVEKVDQLLDKLNFDYNESNINEEIDVTGKLLALLDGDDDN